MKYVEILVLEVNGKLATEKPGRNGKTKNKFYGTKIIILVSDVLAANFNKYSEAIIHMKQYKIMYIS